MNNETSYDALIKSLQMLKRIRRLEGTVMMHEGVMISSETLLLDWQVNDFVQEVNALIAQYRNSSRPLYRALLGFDGGNVLIFNVLPLTLCLIFGKIEDAAAVEKSGEEFLRKWASSLRLNLDEGIDLPQLQPPLAEEPANPLPGTAAETPMPAVEEEIPNPPADPAPAGEIISSPALSPIAIARIESASSPAPAASVSSGVAASLVPSEVSPPVNRAENWASFRQRIENLISKVLGRAQAAKLIDRELAAMGIPADAYLNAAQFRPFGQRVVSKVKDKSLRRLLEMEMISHVEDHLD